MSYALLNENAFALCFFFLDLRQVRIIVDLRIVLRTHTDNKLDVVVMYELYIYKISVLCCFQCAVRCVFSSELLYISITDKLCQYLFFIFLKFFSLKQSAFRSELININTATRACQHIFYFSQASLKLNVFIWMPRGLIIYLVCYCLSICFYAIL